LSTWRDSDSREASRSVIPEEEALSLAPDYPLQSGKLPFFHPTELPDLAVPSAVPVSPAPTRSERLRLRCSFVPVQPQTLCRPPLSSELPEPLPQRWLGPLPSVAHSAAQRARR